MRAVVVGFLGVVVAASGCGLFSEPDRGGEGDASAPEDAADEADDADGPVCTDDGSSDDPNDVRAPEVLADAYQSAIERCFGLEEMFGRRIRDFEPGFVFDAQSLFDRDAFIASFNAALDNDARRFDAQAFDACVGTLTGIADCDLTAVIEEGACSQLFVGRRALGEGCATSTECLDGGHATTCATDTIGEFEGEPVSDSCGTCVLFGDLGEACPAVGCRPELVCHEETSTCELPPEEGEACPVGVCADELICSFETSLCTRLPSEGEGCPELQCAEGLVCNGEQVCASTALPELGDECENGACGLFSTGLACDVLTNRCVEAVVVHVGEACDPLSFEPARYCENQISLENTCVDDDGDGAFVCRALPGAGEACSEGLCRNDGTSSLRRS